MEGNLNMVPGGGSYGGGLDQQGSMRYNHHHRPSSHAVTDNDLRQGPALHPSIHDVFPPFTVGTMQDCGDRSLSLADYNKAERARNVTSDDDEPGVMEDAGNCHNGGQDASSGYRGGGGGRMKFALMQKKGKWKSISKVMAERGFYVSPQQCEDKFNDLNKRYKRLNDILGRGTSCQVVEKPELLDMMDHLSEKSKEDVRKILSSKHLFYEEMCSYHNGNRLHLPHDPALQRALHLALESREMSEISDGRRKSVDDYDEDDHGGESDDCDEFEECHVAHGDSRALCGVMEGSSAKRTKQDLSHDEFSFGNAQEGCKISQLNTQNVHIAMNQAYPEGSKSAWYNSQMMQSRSLKLEEKRTKIQMEMLELEKQRLKWQRFSKKKDRELEKMRLENERMKLENESMALELKRREIGLKGD
uniref:Myb/SANT-like DNA-binding domain-containing protein n=1 Tax=Kalanchoe fedtschenkoi TaxID=63787 RepID=A0A7N0TUB5_KALFE